MGTSVRMARGTRAARAASSRPAAGRSRLLGQAQPPARLDVVGVDEALAATHVPAKIDDGQGRPVGTVIEEIIRDAPQRVAALHGKGRSRVGRGRVRDACAVRARRCALLFVHRSPDPEERRRARATLEVRCGRTRLHRRDGCSGRCGQRDRPADRRHREHADGDAGGNMVQDRRAARRGRRRCARARRPLEPAARSTRARRSKRPTRRRRARRDSPRATCVRDRPTMDCPRRWRGPPAPR